MTLTIDERQTIWDTFCRTLTSDVNPTVRAKAAEALGKLGNPTFTPILLDALADRSPLVRHTVIQSLGKIGSTAAIPALIATLTEENSELSTAAALALGELRAEAAIPALLQTLTAPTPSIRSSGAAALGQIGSPTAVPALLAAWQIESDSTAIAQIIDALAAIMARDDTSNQQIQTIAKQIVTRSTNSKLRQSAVILLGKIALADSIPDLLELLKDPDINVVQSAIEALGNAAA